MSIQPLVQKHFYDLPTCLLEVWSERSPLSEWSDRPIAQNLRFCLTVAENGRFGRSKQKTIKGNQNLLGKIIETVADYADKFLAEDNFASLSHHLSIPDAPKLKQLNLSTLQLFDLVSSLEQCAIEIAILPTVELEVKRITPAWLKIAALVIATVGVSTSAVSLIFNRPSPELVTSSNRETGVIEPPPLSNEGKKEIISAASPAPLNNPTQDQNSAPPASRSQPPTPIPSPSNQTTTPPIKIGERSPQPSPQNEPIAPESKSPSPSPPPELDKNRLEPIQPNAPEPRLGDTQPIRRNPIASPNLSGRKDATPNSTGSFRSDPLSDSEISGNDAQNTQKISQHDLRKPLPTPPIRPDELSTPAIVSPVSPVAPSTPPNTAITSGKVTSQSRSVQSRDLVRSRLPVKVNPHDPQAGIFGATIANIQIESIETTLSDDIKTSLSNHIKTTSLSNKASGEVVFDISIDRGKVLQVKPDETVSTLENNLVVENLRRSLLNWQAPESASGKIRLGLSVRASSK